jgi:predicted nucleic acid-binding OB-fold protein
VKSRQTRLNAQGYWREREAKETYAVVADVIVPKIELMQRRVTRQYFRQVPGKRGVRRRRFLLLQITPYKD